jgi:iron complex transport system substrate-binding protein
MKKLIFPFLLLLALMLSGCGATETSTKSESTENLTETTTEKAQPDTITYQSENGPVEVPANPQRVIVLATYTGNVLSLDVPLVGVDSWSKMNPRYDLDGVEEVTDESLEKILELEPDLIIGLSSMKNVEKLKEIAPVVTFTYGKLDY